MRRTVAAGSDDTLAVWRKRHVLKLSSMGTQREGQFAVGRIPDSHHTALIGCCNPSAVRESAACMTPLWPPPMLTNNWPVVTFQTRAV